MIVCNKDYNVDGVGTKGVYTHLFMAILAASENY